VPALPAERFHFSFETKTTTGFQSLAALGLGELLQVVVYLCFPTVELLTAQEMDDADFFFRVLPYFSENETERVLVKLPLALLYFVL